MKEEIDWKKELLESGRFNDKFSTNLLENGSYNFMQGIYLGWIFIRDGEKLEVYTKKLQKEKYIFF
tara:strand:- start:1223 stop:1420 length:198 start_codon:yes stop_codon:yes gene_type:complete